jgi:hypothetical protein
LVLFGERLSSWREIAVIELFHEHTSDPHALLRQHNCNHALSTQREDQSPASVGSQLTTLNAPTIAVSNETIAIAIIRNRKLNRASVGSVAFAHT